MQIKTISTTTGVNKIDFGDGNSQSTAHFYWLKNLSDSTLYVSANPDPIAEKDDVAELPAKGAVSVETDEGKVYVLGAGKVEIHRTNSKFCPFDQASSGSGGGNVDYATNAGSADYAKNADHATNADNATNAENATNATNATNADNATNAENATNATNATNADHATNADNATNAENADHATNADNADTVGGLPADGFIKTNNSDAYDCNTLYDAGLYLCNGSATNTPNNLIYGSLLVMPYRKPYHNAGPDYCAQIFIPNGDADDPSLWYRTSLQNSWGEWKRSCDGGNANTVNGHMVNIDVPADAVFTDTVPDLSPYVKTADAPNIKVNSASNADTVDGLHASDFYTSGNKPYVTGESSNFDSAGRLVTNHGFIPSAAFIWVRSSENPNEQEKKGFILDATYGEYNTENAIMAGHAIGVGSSTYGYIIFK